MVGYLQPLAHNFAIVNELGYPTEYFIRWAQQKQIDIGESVDEGRALEIVKTFLTEHPLQAGSGIDLTPDGDLNNSPTISAKAQEILDQIATTQGSVLFRGAAGWEALPPGTSTQYLKSGGPAANPLWGTPTGGGGGGPSFPPPETNFRGSMTFSRQYFGGRYVQAPDDVSISTIYARVRTANASAQVTPVVYSVNAAGDLTNVLATGPTIVGVSAGLVEMPLTASLSLTKGQTVAIGWFLRVSDVVVCDAEGYSAIFTSTSLTPPNPAPSTTVGSTSWTFWAD